MVKYVEYRAGLQGEVRDSIISLDDLPTRVDIFTDCYRSLFYYDQSILNHVQKEGSVKGYKGSIGVDRILFDLDHQDLNQAKKDTIMLIERLKDQYNVQPEELSIFFSGGKGFGLEINTAGIACLDGYLDINLPIIIKRFCISIAKDLESFDSVIYNHNRIYRIENTVHQKSGLFKTLLTPDEVYNMSVEDIQKKATELSLLPAKPVVKDGEKLCKKIKELIKGLNDVVKSIELPSINLKKYGNSDIPKYQKHCIWTLASGKYTDQRDNGLIRLADHYKKQGMQPEVIKGLLFGVVNLMNENNPEKARKDPIKDEDVERIIRQTFNNTFDYGCGDSLLDSICSRSCYLAPAKFDTKDSDVKTLFDAYNNSVSYFTNYSKNIVKTEFKDLDVQMPMLLGTFNIITATPGKGKTALMLNMLKHVNQNNTHTLFYNLDMAEHQVIHRLSPLMYTDETGNPIITLNEFMRLGENPDETIMAKIGTGFEDLSKNVLISSKEYITVEDIDKQIEVQEQLWGKKIKFVIIDYIQQLKSHFKDEYQNHTFNAHALANLAKVRNVCVLGISQETENDSGEKTAKGSKTFEERCSTMISFMRPFMKDRPELDYFVKIQMTKNRLGPVNKPVILFFDATRGYIRDVSEEESLIFETTMQQLENEK